MATEDLARGYALGANIGNTVARGIAEWRQLQQERQQEKELEAGVGLYNQRTLASRQAINSEPENILAAYEAQLKRSPNATIEQRTTGEVGEDGQAKTESVIRTDQGDIPVAQMNQLKAAKIQNQIGLTMADFDALMELQVRYPNNPKVKQFVALTGDTILRKWQLQMRAQEQQSLQLAREQAALQFQAEQRFKQEQLQLEREQFEAAPERAREEKTFATDEAIRQSRATIEAQKQADIEKASAIPKEPKAPTEYDKKLGQLANRAQEALDALESIDYDRTSAGAGVESLLPSAARSGKRQQVEQAQLQFVNSILRSESGATITEDEIGKAIKQYFPQVGDSPEVVAQKSQARRTAVASMRDALGEQAPAGAAGAPTAAGDLPDDIKALLEKY